MNSPKFITERKNMEDNKDIVVSAICRELSIDPLLIGSVSLNGIGSGTHKLIIFLKIKSEKDIKSRASLGGLSMDEGIELFKLFGEQIQKNISISNQKMSYMDIIKKQKTEDTLKIQSEKANGSESRVEDKVGW